MRQHVVDLTSQPIQNLVPNPVTASTTGILAAISPQAWTGSFVATGGPYGAGFARLTSTVAATPASGSDLLQLGRADWVAGTGATIPSTCPVIPGRHYVMSAYVRSSVGRTVRIQAQMIRLGTGALGTTGGSAVTLAANVWTRLTLAFVGGSDAQAVRLDIDHMTPVMDTTVGETFDFSMAMITEGDTVYPFSDGNTPGWRWTGTADNSVSTGHPWGADLTRNVAARTLSMFPGLAQAATGVYQTTATANPATLTQVFDPVPGTNIAHALDVSWIADASRTWNVAYGVHNVTIRAGETWTLSFYLKSTGGQVMNAPSLRESNGNNPVYVGAGTVTTTTSWQRVTRTFVATVDATVNNAVYVTPTTVTAAGQYRIAGVSLERGTSTAPYTPPYVARPSTVPIADLQVYPTSALAATSAALTVGSMIGRTFYTVVDVLSTADFIGSGALGDTVTGTGKIAFQTAGTPLTGIGVRFDTSSGSSNTTVYDTGVTRRGRHVLCAWTNDGMTLGGFCIDGRPDVTVTLTPGGGMPQFQVVAQNATVDKLVFATTAYIGMHDRNTRLTVTAYLARLYGAPVPAGF